MAKRKSKPIVAVVGRPNVGKSTLFNVLAGENISIVKDTPGITRDRIYADITWLNRSFTLIDTGGIEPDSNDIILSQMRQQAEIAMDTADVIIAKGMANTETLYHSGYPIYYAFLVKCVRFVEEFGKPLMTPMLVKEK